MKEKRTLNKGMYNVHDNYGTAKNKYEKYIHHTN